MKLLAVSIPFLAALSAHAGEKTSCYSVEGMTCAACSITIKVAVKKLDGIATVTVDSKKDSVKVTFEDKKLSSGQVAKAIADSGYKASEKTCEN